jgi:hypothetical protein
MLDTLPDDRLVLIARRLPWRVKNAAIGGMRVNALAEVTDP